MIRRFHIERPGRFRLASYDPADTGGLDLDKVAADAMLARESERLGRLQERFYACGQWALLVVLQGMDTAGKDGVIKYAEQTATPKDLPDIAKVKAALAR